MIVNRISLSWYVDKLRSGEPFSLTKHSDASLYCMQGRKGGDCNGCDYTPELRQGLLDSIHYDATGFHHGIQRLTDRDNEAFDALLAENGIVGRTWIDTGILASQFVDGGLYPLIDVLRQLGERVCIVSNDLICGRVGSILPSAATICTPHSNTYAECDEIRRLVFCEQLSECRVFLFSCGMAACAMIPKLHRCQPGTSFIDVGHLWDALLGNKIRHYQRDLTQDHIDRNLRPKR